MNQEEVKKKSLSRSLQSIAVDALPERKPMDLESQYTKLKISAATTKILARAKNLANLIELDTS